MDIALENVTKGNRNVNGYRTKIREFVIENFLYGEENGLKNNTLFIEEGIIDSTGVLELVEFLEKEFDIRVEDEELIPENLNSIENTAKYISLKLG